MNKNKDQINISLMTYSSLCRYKKMFLDNLDEENIPREELEQLVLKHFKEMTVDKNKIATEFFALMKDGNVDSAKR